MLRSTQALTGALLTLLAAACSSVDGDALTELAQQIAEDVAPVVAPDLAASANPVDLPADAVEDLTPPEGVERLIASRGGSTSGGGERSLASIAVAVFPVQGEPYCIILGVDDAQDSRGIYATGDAAAGCRDAKPWVPVSDPLLAG